MGAKETILVVDDEPGIRQGCRRALEPHGFEVVAAANITEALLKIKDQPFALALIDVMMPDGRGVDLLGPLLAKDADIVCVIITGFATVELAVEAIKRGAYDFIAKPFTADVLVMTVNQGLEKRRLSLEAKRLQRVEQEAAQLVKDKEEMERLNQFKTQFMLTVAHELRSPVGGAQSLIRTLARGLAGEVNERQKEILGRIEGRMDLLMTLIDDLLALAETKAVEVERKLEEIDLQPVLRQLMDRFSDEAGGKNIHLELQSPPDGVFIQATQDGLVKIFGNLIGNAIKYTPEGGRVSVKVEELDRTVQVSVSDTGIGIAAEDLPNLGDEFFRARNALEAGIKGTGLGLSIVKQLVDHFGGEMAVTSKVGQGTTFTLKLVKDSSGV
jgi:two-component system sensor histidine kinase/response regulator